MEGGGGRSRRRRTCWPLCHELAEMLQTQKLTLKCDCVEVWRGLWRAARSPWGRRRSNGKNVRSSLTGPSTAAFFRYLMEIQALIINFRELIIDQDRCSSLARAARPMANVLGPDCIDQETEVISENKTVKRAQWLIVFLIIDDRKKTSWFSSLRRQQPLGYRWRSYHLLLHHFVDKILTTTFFPILKLKLFWFFLDKLI